MIISLEYLFGCLIFIFIAGFITITYKVIHSCEYRKLIINTSDYYIVFAMFAMAFFFCLPAIILVDVPTRDTSYFYTPMIRAIARGDWEHSYFPMIPPLFSTLGGLLSRILFLDAFTAGKIISALFFSLTVFPLYFIKKQIFSKQVAIVATCLFICCSRLIHYGTSGGIDTAKMFFIVLFVYSFLEFIYSQNWKILFVMSISLAGMSLSRGEGIAISLFFILIPFLFEISKKKLPVKSIIVGCLMFVLLTPWMIYEYKTVGFPVTDSRQIGYIYKIGDIFNIELVSKNSILAKKSQNLLKYENEINIQNTKIQSDNTQNSISSLQKLEVLWKKLFLEFWKGLYPFYFIFAIPVLLKKIKKKDFSKKEKLLIIIFVIHTFIILGVVSFTFTQKRYIIQAMPLLLGWSAIAFISIFSYFENKKLSQVYKNLMVCFIAIFITLSLNSGIKCVSPFSKKRNIEKEYKYKKISKIINNINFGKISEPLKTTKFHYANGGFPRVLASEGRVACMSFSEHIDFNFTLTVSLKQLNKLCEIQKVNIILYDEILKNFCPELDKVVDNDKFTFVEQINNIKIYKVK